MVFNNEPSDKDFVTLTFRINNNGKSVRTVICNRGQVDGVTIDLTGLSDGSYNFGIGYKVNVGTGFKLFTESYAFDIEVKGGKASFKLDDWYAENLKITANERTDAYALDFYKSTFETQ